MLWTILTVLFVGNGLATGEWSYTIAGILFACLGVRGAVMRWDKPGAFVNAVGVVIAVGVLVFQLNPSDGEEREEVAEVEEEADQTAEDISRGSSSRKVTPLERLKSLSGGGPKTFHQIPKVEEVLKWRPEYVGGLGMKEGEILYLEGQPTYVVLNEAGYSDITKAMVRYPPNPPMGDASCVFVVGWYGDSNSSVRIRAWKGQGGGTDDYEKEINEGEKRLPWIVSSFQAIDAKGAIEGLHYAHYCRKPHGDELAGRAGPDVSAPVATGNYVSVRARPALQATADMPFDKPAGCMMQTPPVYSQNDGTYEIEYREAPDRPHWGNYKEHITRGGYVWRKETLRVKVLSGTPIADYLLYCQDQRDATRERYVAPAVPVPFSSAASMGEVVGEAVSEVLDIPRTGGECYLRLQYMTLNDNSFDGRDDIFVEFTAGSGKTLWAPYNPLYLANTQAMDDVRIRIESGKYRDMSYGLECVQ